MADREAKPVGDSSENAKTDVPEYEMDSAGAGKPLQSEAVTDEKLKIKGVAAGGMERGFYMHFMNPMMAQLEKTIGENNKILEDINKKFEEERNENRKKRLGQHIPEILQGEGQKLEKIVQNIENLITYQNTEGEEDEADFRSASMKELNETTHMALVSHALSAYVSTLDPPHLKRLATHIRSEVTVWLSKLFRFNEAAAYFHEEEREGLLRLCRLALLHHYPKFASDGYEALYARPPVVYLSAAAKPGLGQYICAQLGLPLSCLCTVPCNTMFGSTHKIDVATFEKLVQDDISSGKTPVLLVAYAGTPVVGHVDNLQRLREICKKNDIWLHVEGNNLVTLALYSVPTSVVAAKSCDSMTLNMTCWLGLPSVPFVTMYKSSDPALDHAAGLKFFHDRYKVSSLPLWACLQSIGHEGVVNRVQHCISLAKLLSQKLTIFPKILNLVIFEIENPTVVFRYSEQPQKEEKGEEDGDNSTTQVTIPQKDSYYDALNIWLAETMKRESPRLYTTVVDVEPFGVCIRFAPLETANIYDTKQEDIDAYIVLMANQLSIMDATVSQRAQFQAMVDDHDNLALLHLHNWAGLGAVQYIPELWLSHKDSLPDEGRNEVNTLNTNLVHQLKASDTAFSLGMSEDGLTCVRFGLITGETDLEELIGTVYTTGKEVEESSKFLETMAEVVRQGIEKANEDLQKEHQDRIQKEGFLRQVPVVSSLYNWWSPPPKDVAERGRTFNLASGRVQSTESTYKYQMQFQETTPEPSPRALKPPSRTSSQSSQGGASGGHSHTPDTSPSQAVAAEAAAASDGGKHMATGPVEAGIEVGEAAKEVANHSTGVAADGERIAEDVKRSLSNQSQEAASS